MAQEPTPEKKLGMSLDALIAQDRKQNGPNRAGHGREFQGRGKFQQGRGGFQGRGRAYQQQQQWGGREPDQRFRNGEQHRGGRGGGRGGPGFQEGRNIGQRPPHQPFPEGTIFLPNFGAPFGAFPPQGLPHMFMTEQMFGGMPPGMANGGAHREQATPQAPAQPKATTPAPVPLARMDEETGEVTVRLKGKVIVKVSKSGTITLNADGMRTAILFMALNAVLNTVGVSITRPQNNDEWSIQDGRSLIRFRDGATLAARGPQSLQRGPKILTAFGGADPNAAAAATLASNAAAEAAGIVLGKKKDNQQPNASGNKRAAETGPSSDSAPGSGGKSSEDPDHVRRLKAKGRYKPY